MAVNAVYPRWRGEHSLIYLSKHSWHGLSPLARGTLFPGARYYALGRFIPAGAGNTLLCASLIQWAAVYPRWRGEHQKRQVIMAAIIGLSRWRGEHNHVPAAATTENGLSPLARGTRSVSNSKFTNSRFIPAGAGNTQTR